MLQTLWDCNDAVPEFCKFTGLCPGHVRPAVWWLSRQGGVLKLGILGTANFQVLVDEISTHNFECFFCTNLTSSHANVKQGQNLVSRTVFIATTFSATRIDDFLGFVLNTPFLSRSPHSPGCNATNCVRRTGMHSPHRDAPHRDATRRTAFAARDCVPPIGVTTPTRHTHMWVRHSPPGHPDHQPCPHIWGQQRGQHPPYHHRGYSNHLSRMWGAPVSPFLHVYTRGWRT